MRWKQDVLVHISNPCCRMCDGGHDHRRLKILSLTHAMQPSTGVIFHLTKLINEIVHGTMRFNMVVAMFKNWFFPEPDGTESSDQVPSSENVGTGPMA
jgi:hypothetical protein